VTTRDLLNWESEVGRTESVLYSDYDNSVDDELLCLVFNPARTAVCMLNKDHCGPHIASYTSGREQVIYAVWEGDV